MWTGAIIGLAGLKFSTSPSIFGLFDTIIISIVIIMIPGMESLIDRRGLNFTLSMFVFVFDGFEEPFSCRRIRWIIAVIEIINGRRK